jgi:BNR/Asp-box repeat
MRKCVVRGVATGPPCLDNRARLFRMNLLKCGLLIAISFVLVFVNAPTGAATVLTNARVTPPPSAHWIQNAQAEPSLAINPLDPNNIVVGYLSFAQLSCTQNSANQTACPVTPSTNISTVSVTKDGGLTWTQTFLKPDPAVGVYQLFGDMLVLFGPRPLPGGGFAPLTGPSAASRVYALTVANVFNSPVFSEVLYYSDDNGANWTGPIVISSNNPAPSKGKNVDRPEADIVMDQNSPFYGRLLVSYINDQGPNRASPVSISGETLVVQFSDDGGVTWSKKDQIGNAAQNLQVGDKVGIIYAKIAVGPNGAAYVVANHDTGHAIAVSTDGGRKFSNFVKVTDNPLAAFPGSDAFYGTYQWALPGGAARFYASPHPYIAVNPITGKVIVAYNAFSYDPATKKVHGVLKIATSTDQGKTWSTPAAPIVDVPGHSVVLPTMDVDRAGLTFFIGYLLVADNPVGTPQGTDTRQDAAFVLSYDGGNSWTPSTVASTAPSNASAGFRRTLTTGFLGEFIEGKFDRDGYLQFVWTDTRNGGNCGALWNFVNAGGYATSQPFDFVSQCLAGNSTNSAIGNTDIYWARILK